MLFLQIIRLVIPCDANGPIEPYIKQVLDSGAYGVVVPHCSTAIDAERVVQACRYPQKQGDSQMEPLGKRGASPWLCSYLWGLTMEEYAQRADVWPLDPQGDLLAVIMIEDVLGVENIEEILSVKGIGAVIFGPYDFSFSCGAYGNMEDPVVIQAKEKVYQACKKHNVPFIALANPQNLEQIIEEKHQIILCDTDVNMPDFLLNVIDQVKVSSQ